MTLAIVSDSNSSLPTDLIRELPLYVVPLEVHHEGRVYRDGVDLMPGGFYALQAESATLPTTSAPLPGAFLDAFQQAAEHADEVVCLTLSSKLSATHDSARTALREATAFDASRVTIVDTQSAAAAQGLMVLAAARMAAGAASAQDLLERVPSLISAVHLYGYLDSLYYVWRSGRVPRVVMWMGRAIGVRPVLQLTDGRIGMVERPRSQRMAMERVARLAQQRADGAPVRVAVMHAAAPEQAAELAQRLNDLLSPVELFTTELTPVIGAHVGPGLVGCAVHRLDPSELLDS
jgi:DegV family protein with EDD domain